MSKSVKDKMWVWELCAYRGKSGKCYSVKEYLNYEKQHMNFKPIPKEEYPLEGTHKLVYK